MLMVKQRRTREETTEAWINDHSDIAYFVENKWRLGYMLYEDFNFTRNFNAFRDAIWVDWSGVGDDD